MNQKINRKKMAVLGAGAFGSAFAKLLSVNYDISLWARDLELVQAINLAHQHPKRLAGVFFPKNVTATANMEEALADSILVISALPLVSLRSVWTQATQFLPPDAYILSLTKGIEQETLELPAGILQQILPSSACARLTFLSGPTFAQELAAFMPAAATLAAIELQTALDVQKMISLETFRTYVSTDVAGVELGGALKNVIAIAAGIGHGLNLGQNAQAALITRGIAEVARLAVAMGAQPLTLAGLSGLGDLVLTCSSTMSRNFRLGSNLSLGMNLEAALLDIGQTVEGVNTAKSARQLSQKFSIEMPISESVYSVLFEGVPSRQAAYDLMTRKLTHEHK